MAPPMKKAVNQNELRRLMKERRDSGKTEPKIIDSPIAKYDSNGTLTCTVCRVPIKNQALWSAHLVSKVHKNNLESLKKVKQTPSILATSVTQKRSLGQSNGPSRDYVPLEKKAKSEQAHSMVQPVATQNLLAQDYSSSDESEHDGQGGIATKSDVPEPIISQLPAGFFDEPQTNQAVPPKKQKSNDPPDNNTTLPEGFFDDPVLDAKVRKVEYKDPMDEEWEKFQKTITEENNVSQAIIEEDLVESTLEREIDEIDEQIHNWARVEALLQRKETISVKDVKEDQSGSSSADEQDYEELLDWRAKGAWKKS